MQKLLLALLTLTVGTPAVGQISYTDIADTTVSATTQQQMVGYNVNFDGDTVYEKQIRHFNPGGTSPTVELGNYPSPSFDCQEIILPDGHAKVLQAGDSISSTAATWGHDQYGILNAPWYGGEKYLGVRFKKSGKWYYGWIRFYVPADRSGFTMLDWAYNTTANQGLMGGQPVETGITHISKTGIRVGMGEGVVRITSTGNAIARLCDVSGRVVKTTRIHGEGVMTVSDMPPGIYILTVFSGIETYSSKLLIR